MMPEAERFRNFISAIFYIGKGTRSRPYYHLYEAFKSKQKESKVRSLLTAPGIKLLAGQCEVCVS